MLSCAPCDDIHIFMKARRECSSDSYAVYRSESEIKYSTFTSESDTHFIACNMINLH